MRALYIDESARDNRFYFFGGLLVDDDAARSLEVGPSGIGRLLAENVPGFDRETELHGNEMFHGHGAWAGVPIPWRVKACELVSKAIARSGAEYTFRGIDLVALRATYGFPHPAHLLTSSTTSTDDSVKSTEALHWFWRMTTTALRPVAATWSTTSGG